MTFNISYIGGSDPISGGTPYGDVWYEGGYAYVGTDVNGGGMNIFSISNAGVPIFVKRYAGDQFEDVEVWDGWGYFGSDVTIASSGTGVDIVDLAIPALPKFEARVDGSLCSAAGCGHDKVHTLSVSKGYLYTADNATDVIKITRIFDPNDPELVNPVVVKSLDLGLGPIASPASNIAAHEVQVRNDRMYVASKDNNFDFSNGWTSIYDVADPTNPKLLTKFQTGGRSHTATPTADGRTLIVAQEKTDGEVRIYDISMINQENDPDNPVLLSTLTRTSVGIEASSPHHPHLHGNLLFIPWYEAGLQVFNIVDPAHPVHVGAFDTYPGTSTLMNGNWGVDLSLGLNKVMLSDRSRGLIVVNASGVLAPGDFNQDMEVNTADYTAWRNTFGTDSSGLHTGAFADGSNNGVVDAADYVVWRSHLGQSGPLGQGAGASIGGESSVPEPATILLFAAGVGLLISRCRVRAAR